MKSTYSLLGFGLDQKQRLDMAFNPRPYDASISEIGDEQLTIFDVEHCRRYVSISRVFEICDSSMFDECIELAASYDYLYVLLDYSPSCCNKIVEDFYQLRVLQFCGLVRSFNPEVNIELMEGPKRYYAYHDRPVNTLLALIEYSDFLIGYLCSKGIEFSSTGYPILSRSDFHCSPLCITTYSKRGSFYLSDSGECIICNFTDDASNYRRLRKVFQDIPELSRFQGVVGTDVTVTADMDIEWQRFIILVNQLYEAVLLANGINVVYNLRIGSEETLDCLDYMPKNSVWAMSTLGCELTKSDLELRFIAKVMKVRPSRILLYGKADPVLESQLDRMGVLYSRFEDAHQFDKRMRKKLIS